MVHRKQSASHASPGYADAVKPEAAREEASASSVRWWAEVKPYWILAHETEPRHEYAAHCEQYAPGEGLVE